jgi:hypothetical protein
MKALLTQCSPPAAIVSAMALLAGCTYSADVRNTTNGPVLVKMLQVDPIQPDWELASQRVGPGEYARLGPVRVPFQRVVIQVGNQLAHSVPARCTITAGTARLDVGQTASSESGREEVVFTLQRRAE